MNTEEKAKVYDEALKRAKEWITEREQIICPREIVESIFPQLRESEDDKMMRVIALALTDVPEERFTSLGTTLKNCLAYLKKQKEEKPSFKQINDSVIWDNGLRTGIELGKKKEQKPIKMGVYEIGKGTTVCGQDYKCKKDYKTGTCWYIKDAIYHCSRNGYLNDQNGVSWSCTPEWFKEYIQSNTEWAEEEKTRFVSGQFLQCKLSFDEFKEGEHYWLEYIGDDTYVGRSDNILNQKFHITPRQLYTLFSQQLEENEKEQKQVNSLDTMLSKDPHLPKQAVKCKQKPTECIEFDNEFKNQVSHLLASVLNKEWEYDKEFIEYAAQQLLGYAKHEIQPAEWSEEDEKILSQAIETLEHENYFILADKLKSLRPSWKPSEEQMEAFRGYIEDFQERAEAAVGGWNNFDVMIRLYEQLLKLM